MDPRKRSVLLTWLTFTGQQWNLTNKVSERILDNIGQL